MSILWILCVCLVQNSAHPNSEVQNKWNFRPPNIAANSVDALGLLTQLLEKVYTQLTPDTTPLLDDECKTRAISIGLFVTTLIGRPFGLCSYCCPFKNFTRHVRLYFTNKSMLGTLVQLKIAKRAGALHSAGVDANLTTVVYIHGFTEIGIGYEAGIIRDAYLQREENYNIIMVDWRELSAGPWYPQAVDNGKHVGRFLAETIKFYHGTGELSISKLHIIGFSLGAQVAGFAGKYLRRFRKLSRITALDPAFPMFPLKELPGRDWKLYAEFVDVIHTDGGILGYPSSMGHADFYPNGGMFHQPGCEASKFIDHGSIHKLVICGHFRALQFYAESVVNPSAFPATKCNLKQKGAITNCGFIVHGYMGFPANKDTSLGNFYLTTGDRPPFSRSAEEQERDMIKNNLLS